MEPQTVEPFILIRRDLVESDGDPEPEICYDDLLQLWVLKGTHEPFVTSHDGNIRSSRFGETTMTRTREGVDQNEVAVKHSEAPYSGWQETQRTETLKASRFGETTMTKTQEGVDQSEGADWLSPERISS